MFTGSRRVRAFVSVGIAGLTSRRPHTNTNSSLPIPAALFPQILDDLWGLDLRKSSKIRDDRDAESMTRRNGDNPASSSILTVW
jgi:hypothetical protein